MTYIIHPSGIKQSIVDKVVKRRGGLHAFNLDAAKTALVVVDLDTGTVVAGRRRDKGACATDQ